MIIFNQTAVDWTQIILQLITTAGLVIGGVLVAYMNRRVGAIKLVGENNQLRTMQIQEDMKTPSGQTMGHLSESTYDMAAANHANILMSRDIALKNAVRKDEQLKEIHTLVNDRLEAALTKIDDLRGELQVLRGRRHGG